MAVSNRTGTLKCPMRQYGNIAHRYFSKWSSEQEIDTIAYSFPLAKYSIKERIFTPEGKVYLLKSSENNVLVYDLFADKILDTISIPDQGKRDSYFHFGVDKNQNDYEYYKNLITPKIQDPLCTI